MKPDEIALYKVICNRRFHETIRDAIDTIDIPPKRVRYILNKWADKNWYDYGIDLDLGWMTPEGIEAMNLALQETPIFRGTRI